MAWRGGGSDAEEASVVGGEIAEVVEAAGAGRVGDGEAWLGLQSRAHRVEAERAVIGDRPEPVAFMEGEPQGAVADAQFAAEINRAKLFATPGPHQLLGTLHDSRAAGQRHPRPGVDGRAEAANQRADAFLLDFVALGCAEN